MTDQELIEQCLSGSQRAQRALFDKFSGKMMAVCMRYVADRERAADVLQDGFVKVFRSLDKFKGDGSFEGWIRRAMVNTSLDYLRKKKLDEIDVDNNEEELIDKELLDKELLDDNKIDTNNSSITDKKDIKEDKTNKKEDLSIEKDNKD